MKNLFDITRATDSYKITHWKQYPPGTQRIHSYFEARDVPPWETMAARADVVFFGLQYFLKQYLTGVRVTAEGIDKSAARMKAHFGTAELFNAEGWKYILQKYGGRLPLQINAVPEGTVTPIRNVLMTVENLDPNCFWLPNWVETLLVQLWYPCTVASHSRHGKSLIRSYLRLTGDEAGLPFKLHDFGFRGVTCPEQAALGGAAHLVNFQGTDTLIACDMLMDLYNAEMPGFSIPASEHSTITSWGRAHELDAFANMLTQFPEGLVACVSDSYDIMHAVNQYWGKDLKDRILSRNGTLVVRPDSGDPVPTILDVLEGLEAAFGTTINSKGYKVLPPQIRVIQGDRIDGDMLGSILRALMKEHWSVDNIAFGSGGGLLQKFNRDMLGFAMKTCFASGDGWERPVFKDPVSMSSKRSKSGLLKLVMTPGGFETVPANAPGVDVLRSVFACGDLFVDDTFSEIRKRAELV